MRNVNLETKFKFDYSLSTEERFSFRRFLEQFVKDFNEEDLTDLEEKLATWFEVYGLTTDVMKLARFLKFIGEERTSGGIVWYRFPELKVRKKNDMFEVNGSMEALNSRTLFLEGEVDMKCVFTSDGYKVTFLAFSPRFRMNV